MQHDGCDEIQLLISRFVDDEVSPSERERVEQHVGACDACAYKLIEYMEMAVLFSETPLQQPAPELRSSLFREINTIKEEARRKEILSASKERSWFLPASPKQNDQRAAKSTFAGRLMQAASPFAVAAVALFVFLGALLLGGNLRPTPVEKETKAAIHPPAYIPTLEAPIEAASVSGSEDAPPPVETRVGMANASPAAPSTSYVNATATLGRNVLIKLTQPTPVLETDGSDGKSSWHVMRDPAYGYTLQYPPNWWTRVVGNTRYFYPWTSGGTRFAPYWVEMNVYPNDEGLTATSGNNAVCGGDCTVVSSDEGAAVWLRRTIQDADNYYDEGYIFDSRNYYRLRVSVPRSSVDGMLDADDRMKEVQDVFAVMSGRLGLADEQRNDNSAFGGVLFLNGTDLWLANVASKESFKVTRNLRVRQFAQSPELGRVAFAATQDQSSQEPWASAIYLTQISSQGPVAPTLLLSDMEIHDIAWYSDHELLTLARSKSDGLGIYSVAVPASRAEATEDGPSGIVRLVQLPDELSGAKSLAVSPDRQLITFLGPIGDKQGTDIYAVRPDGSDLIKLVSHTAPAAPVLSGNPVLAPESQAIKSYTWADGHLEPGGYAANLIFTCGSSDSPSWNLGGFLYSVTGAAFGPLVDPFGLVQFEPERMQITHIAYSTTGKVALTGYRKDYNGRADQLVGLWTGDLINGNLFNIAAQPGPENHDGATDLQWSPDGRSLIYREMMPFNETISSARYDGRSNFRLMKLDLDTQKTVTLFDGVRQ
ncbi:MAG: zf-HC2 domain-containing protein [Chloroflexota bacterium]